MIGLLAADMRAVQLEKILADYEVSTVAVEAHSVKRQLLDWRRLGYKTAVIDEEGFCDQPQLEAALISFLHSTPPKGSAALRLIFIADETRQQGNEFLSHLVSLGCFDLIVPAVGDSLENDLPERAACAAVYANVQGYDLHLPQVIETYRAARSVVGGENLPKIKVVEKLVGAVTIGVIGTIARAGTTHFALTLARFLARREFKVACVISDSLTYKDLRRAYEHSLADNGSSFKICDVEYFCGSSKSDCVGEHDFIVIDLGEWTCEDSLEADFKRCDVKVVISDGTPWNIGFAEERVALEDVRDVACWHWGFFGADESMIENIREGLEIKASGVHVFSVSYNPNPAVTDRAEPPEVATILSKYLPKTVEQIEPPVKGIKHLFHRGAVRRMMKDERERPLPAPAVLRKE
jgi:hypothetical protein